MCTRQANAFLRLLQDTAACQATCVRYYVDTSFGTDRSLPRKAREGMWVYLVDVRLLIRLL